MKSQNGISTNGTVQSVNRALDLLEVFLSPNSEVGLTEIASRLNLDKATAYRLLNTLEKRGYVERPPETRRYRLGLRAFEIGAAYQNQLEIRRLGLNTLQEMVRQTGEDAFLCIREDDFALCVEKVDALAQVNIYTLRVGGRQALHLGAAPRALLSGLSDQDLADYAARTGLPPATPYSLKNLAEITEDAHSTQKNGYTLSLNDATVGIAAVGAPIYDRRNQVAASISLSGLANRYETDRLEPLIHVVHESAQQLSRQMGSSLAHRLDTHERTSA